jgi:ABC-type glycerol-3-phosphate transport system substrate-binding protein
LKFKFNLKKAFYLVIISMLLPAVLFLMSCSIFKNKEADVVQTDTAAETSLTPQEEESGPTELLQINVWDDLNPKEQIELMNDLEQFSKENPGIKIKSRHLRSEEELIDQFKAASLAGAGPEILIARIEASSELAASSVLKPLTDENYYSDILSGLLEISLYEDKRFVIPFRAYDFLMLFYNKDLVQKVPATFSELLTYCVEVNNPKEETFGFLLNSKEADWIIPFVGGYQDWIYDYDTGAISLDSEAMLQTLKFLEKIYKEDKLLPYDYEYEDINNAFLTGKAHMIINGSWAVSEYSDAGLNFGVAKIPIVWEGYKNPTPMIDGFGFMVNINCYGESLDATKKLISYFMSAGLQEKWNRGTQTVSVLKSIGQLSTAKNDQNFIGQFDQAGICRGKPPEDILRFIRDAIMINTENVLNGNITAEEAIIKMQEDALSLKSGNTGAGETAATTVKQAEKSNVQSTGETVPDTAQAALETSQNTAAGTTSQ